MEGRILGRRRGGSRPLLLLRGLHVRIEAVLRGLHGARHLPLALAITDQGGQASRVRGALDLLVPAAQSADLNADDAALSPAPDGWLKESEPTMDFAKLNGDLKDMRQRNRRLALAVAGLIFGLLMSLVIIANLIGMERTIIVPPTIDKTFWVTKDRVSKEYLEQMASFIAWLILDVTPATIDWKKDILLNYVAPEQHGTMKSRQEVEAERLKRINASTFFLPQQLVVNDHDQTVAVRGRLRTQVNGQETATDTKAYVAEFQYVGGRVHLKAFKEISQ